MNEEERQAIERIKEIIKCFYCFPNPISIELKDCDCSTLEIALNLIEKLQKENEELKNQETTARKINELLVQRYSNSISVQKVKDKIEEIQKEYNKLDKQVDEYINDVNKELSKYYENKERIAIMQALSYFIDTLQELIEGRE